MKLVVVGGVAGGASAAARVRRLDAKAQIVMFERGEHVSFSNCCLPYYLSGTVATSDALVLMTPEKFHAQHDIDARVNTEVIEIKRAEKKVVARNLATGETYEESYDKLVLAPGANPILPRSIAGIGININQQAFHGDAPNPVSLQQITGQTHDCNALLNGVMARIIRYYRQLQDTGIDTFSPFIANRYACALFRRKGYHLYKDADGAFSARLLRVEADGRFVLEDEAGRERQYLFKEVQYLL